MRLLIGHVGEVRSGKGAVSGSIAEYARCDGFTVGEIRFSDPLRETFRLLNEERARGKSITDQGAARTVTHILEDIWGMRASQRNFVSFVSVIVRHFGGRDATDPISIDRPNLQKLPQEMEQSPAFGRGVLSRAVFSRVRKSMADIVQVDGIRWLSDEEELRKIKHALMLYTTASFDVRAARARARHRDGEENKSIEQLRLEELAETERYIADIGARADWKIVTDTYSLQDLNAEVERVYTTLVLPRVKSFARMR